MGACGGRRKRSARARTTRAAAVAELAAVIGCVRRVPKHLVDLHAIEI